MSSKKSTCKPILRAHFPEAFITLSPQAILGSPVYKSRFIFEDTPIVWQSQSTNEKSPTMSGSQVELGDSRATTVKQLRSKLRNYVCSSLLPEITEKVMLGVDTLFGPDVETSQEDIVTRAWGHFLPTGFPFIRDEDVLMAVLLHIVIRTVKVTCNYREVETVRTKLD